MASVREELGRTDLEAAERGFLQLLRRKRFSPAFIERHGADLIAKAASSTPSTSPRAAR